MNAPRVDLALLLGKASTFARQWQDQQGCSAAVLDDLAAAVVSYLGDNPQLAQAGGEALRPHAELAVIIDDPIRPAPAEPLDELRGWLMRDVGVRRALFESVMGVQLQLFIRVELYHAGGQRVGLGVTCDDATSAALAALPEDVRKGVQP